jgi:hypothetical protein
MNCTVRLSRWELRLFPCRSSRKISSQLAITAAATAAVVALTALIARIAPTTLFTAAIAAGPLPVPTATAPAALRPPFSDGAAGAAIPAVDAAERAARQRLRPAAADVAADAAHITVARVVIIAAAVRGTVVAVNHLRLQRHPVLTTVTMATIVTGQRWHRYLHAVRGMRWSTRAQACMTMYAEKETDRDTATAETQQRETGRNGASRLYRVARRHSQAPPPEKTASFLSFPYVCPEPVLAK